MEYLLLIADRLEPAEVSDAERDRLHAGHGELAQAWEKAGVKWSGRQLQGPATATTVREGAAGGTDRMVTDGPFAETKEQLGGYYLIDVADLDEALRWARRIPLLAGTAVEVRPVVAR
jgi:hypothetical protein